MKRKRTIGDAVRLDQKDNGRETSAEKSEPGAVENPFKLQIQASLGYSERGVNCCLLLKRQRPCYSVQDISNNQKNIVTVDDTEPSCFVSSDSITLS